MRERHLSHLRILWRLPAQKDTELLAGPEAVSQQNKEYHCYEHPNGRGPLHGLGSLMWMA